MRMKTLIGLVASLGLGLLAGRVGAVATELPPGAVVWDGAALAEEKAARRAVLVEAAWNALRDDGDAASVLQGEPSVLIREWAAAELLQRLQDGPPLAAAEAFLDWAVRQPVGVFVQHEETRAAAFLPLFDIAQRARDVRRLWAEAAAREDWMRRWVGHPSDALERLQGAGPAERQAAAEALSGLPDEAWSGALKALHARPAASVPTELWLAAAQREPDATALREVIARGEAGQRLRALPLLAELEHRPAMELLVELEPDPELGSAATLALVPRLLDAGDAAALRARLADPARRDATAAGLARAAAVAKREAALDALRAALQGDAERAGWQRLQVLLESPAQRKRWALDGEAQP